MSEDLNVSDFGADQSSNSNEERQTLSPMLKRIKALRVLTARLEEIEAEHVQRVHQVEVRYDRLRQVILEKRGTILSGEYEPTEEECNYPTDDEKELDAYRELVKYDATTKGVPRFWLIVLKKSKKVSEYIHPYDEPILAHLQDIKVKVQENPIGFILEFHFSKNEYFNNKVLTKHYEKNTETSRNELFNLEAPEIRACKGCKINWKEGKNVTQNITRTVTPISRTKVKTVTEIIQQDSFFSFFSLPVIPCNLMREKLERQRLMMVIEDSHLGLHFKNRIIPKAVFYFTCWKCQGLEEEAEVDQRYADSAEEPITCSLI